MFMPHAARLRVRIRRTAAVLGGSLVAVMALTAGTAAASGPTFVSGNPDCADIQGSASWTEIKIESPNGTKRAANGDISVTTTATGTLIDFVASTGVDAVIVTGGPNANVYTFAGEATRGDDLHAPVNPSNGGFYGLSHISFCYDRGTPPPPPPGDPCATNPNGMDANGQPCTPPSDPCVANPNGMNSNGQPCTPPRTTTPPPPPVQTSTPSLSPPLSGGSLGAVGQVVPSSATIAGPRRCVSRPFAVVVRGRGIRRVTLFVNGKKFRTVSARRSRYAFRISHTQARGGVIRVQARVRFVGGASRTTKTLRITALRCSTGATQPQFTG